MNAKSRALSVLAAAIISISMFGGATAQSSDSAWTSAQLSDPFGYICVVDIWNTSGDFGIWEFDGTQYNPVTGTTMAFSTDVYGGGMTGCDVYAYFEGLSLNSGSGSWIDPSFFSAYSWYRMDTVDPWGFGDHVPGFNSYNFDYTLDWVPSYMTPGWYQGQVYVYVYNGM